MQKALVVTLSDAELLDLYRILLDHDEAGAWAFVERHLKKQVARALDGG